MFEAQRQWFPRLGSFAHHFRYQYVISRQQEDLDGFSHHQLGPFHLHCGQDLPTHALHDINGDTVGYVIGIAVGPDAKIVNDATRLPFPQGVPDFWAALERFIVETAGRFAFTVAHQGQYRLYTDPVGMIGAVFSRKDGYVAATPLLCIKRKIEENPLFDLDIVRNRGGKISLLHTADRHVVRLNPSFYLDLNSLEATRFWPMDERFTPPPNNPMDVYQDIIARAAANIGALARAFPCSLPISGGQDSRLLLALAKSHRDQIRQYYTHQGNWASRRDAVIAKKLCAAVGVPHEIHDPSDFELSRKQQRQITRAFQITMGLETAPPREYLNGAAQGVQDNNVVLRGHQTDFLRAVYVFEPQEKWTESAWQIERLLIVPRDDFTQDIADKYADTFKAWQATLPENAWDKAADFMFLEIYYASTVGARFPALWRNFFLSPFNSRKLITLALQFSELWRRHSLPVFDILQYIDEGLSAVPFTFEMRLPFEEFENLKDFEALTGARVYHAARRLKLYERSHNRMRGVRIHTSG
jgi:hypothetical protein